MVHACQRHLGNVDDGGHDHDGKNQCGGKQRVTVATPDDPDHRNNDRDAEQAEDNRRDSGQKAYSRLDHIPFPPLGEQRQIDGRRKGERCSQKKRQDSHHETRFHEDGDSIVWFSRRRTPIGAEEELAEWYRAESGKPLGKEVKRNQDDCRERHKGGEQQDCPEPTVNTFS